MKLHLQYYSKLSFDQIFNLIKFAIWHTYKQVVFFDVGDYLLQWMHLIFVQYLFAYYKIGIHNCIKEEKKNCDFKSMSIISNQVNFCILLEIFCFDALYLYVGLYIFIRPTSACYTFFPLYMLYLNIENFIAFKVAILHISFRVAGMSNHGENYCIRY